MTKRMLIDATHEEETRVAVSDGNKLAEYDYESCTRRPLKGNIFLAKVTRVEPSLQAAFVNFGGNRHGFLPFSEIHPDYFRIPIADREALLAEQEALLAEAEEREDADARAHEDDGGHEEAHDDPEHADDVDHDAADEYEEVGGAPGDAGEIDADGAPGDAGEIGNEAPDGLEDDDAEHPGDVLDTDAAEGEGADAGADADGEPDGNRKRGYRRGRRNYRDNRRRSSYRNRRVEVVGGEEIDDEQRFRFNMRRKYKIQEVIKRGQIMLVQVNKEERGNKGAAVGSYLSLPGRYCVLMPNSPRGGGVSRKIANYKDRARMREIVKDLEVPGGMSVIVRTAGVARTKTEIKRDLDYLMRLWDNIRELTLQSSAPAMVYEEADLIKRSVRDLYTRDIEEIIVSGEEGYKTAKNFMKMLIPSHVKKVKLYEDDQLPLFNRYQIEGQINEIGQPEVRLRSGGYLVINPTEALVSIDVNSGKATKERHIEETALKTNLEAADEVARQLKLRDLGGLVVIDFIDMEDRRNNARVERRMKEALSGDRARVQVGRISGFGLMELSRQRLSPSLTEAQYKPCPNCKGVGLVRTADAMSIIVLRAIEEEGIRQRAAQIIVHVSNEVALYILNNKRKNLADIEERYGLEVLLRVDNDIPASDYRIEVSRPAESVSGDDDPAEEGGLAAETEEGRSSSRSARRRGRRGGRNRRDPRKDQDSQARSDDGDEALSDSDIVAEEAGDSPAQTETPEEPRDTAQDDAQPAKRKPSRRKPRKDEAQTADAEAPAAKEDEKPRAEKRKPAKKAPAPSNDRGSEEQSPGNAPEESVSPAVSAPLVARKPAPEEQEDRSSAYETVNEPPKNKKRGWWNRLVE